ncbi:MAG: 6-bladed beta-propeller, partial [Planctomycetota bacterium]|nr:6-bladed beta-propeller [Planctomycetota bacterium]
LRRPCAMALSDDGDWLAIAELEGRVTILDRDFKVVAHLGDNPNQGHWANNGVPPDAWTEGIFTAPHAVQFDAKGNLYIMDWNASGRISKLKRVGQ